MKHFVAWWCLFFLLSVWSFCLLSKAKLPKVAMWTARRLFFSCVYCRMIQRNLHQSLVPLLRAPNQLTWSLHRSHQNPPLKRLLKHPNHPRSSFKTAPTFFNCVNTHLGCVYTSVWSVCFLQEAAATTDPAPTEWHSNGGHVTLGKRWGPHTNVAQPWVRQGGRHRGCRVALLVLQVPHLFRGQADGHLVSCWVKINKFNAEWRHWKGWIRSFMPSL